MIVLHQPATAEHKLAAKAHLDLIMETVARPGGFAKLNATQRKFLMGIVLAAIVPADKRIRNVELERLHIVLKTSLRLPSDSTFEALALAEGQIEFAGPLELVIKALPDLLGIDDRCSLISNLWELALCDRELHAFEEQLVYHVADLADVPRKRVAELMQRAAANA